MKKLFALLFAIVLLLCSCGRKEHVYYEREEGKVFVVASLFPQYDFARVIGGERVQAVKLLPAGTESHTFEPTPSDIVMLEGCDIFLYTGDEMEPWAATLIDGEIPESVKIVDLSSEITLTKTEETDLEDEFSHHHEREDEHSHEFDPHIWTSPKNAKIMVQTVTDALCEADPNGEDYYRANCEDYLNELDALDSRILSILSTAKRTELLFGGRYAFHYLAEEYGLTCYAAYDSCSEESEPSAGAVAALIDEVNEKGIPVIYYEEMTQPRIAKVISEETGADMLLLHSCHNTSADEEREGMTFLSLMQNNIENLERGLK